VNLGSVHAMSHPAGAQFGVPHGVANAIHLPHVIRFNAEDPAIAELYGDLADLIGAEDLASYVEELTASLGLPRRLSQVGVPEQGLAALVEGALGDGTSLLNPREVSAEDYAALYERAL
jgi:alcohol dehydrogenase class IV